MLYCPTCGQLFAADVKTCPDDGAILRADATIAVRLPLDPLAGRVLDEKYRLDSRLGEGGMGTVYRATHVLIDRPVAVKVLHPRFVEDEAAQERFRREARAAGRLLHTNAVTVTDFGRTADGFVYIVMELLEGRNLREVLAFESPMESGRAVALMLQVAAAVEAAHESGVIHRDLKPANIFIVQPKNALPLVKVLDFGIAKLAADTLDEQEQNHLTQTGVMIGTPRYMSPEQCDGAHLTPAADVYSLGIILYEMLTGSTPFTGASPLAVALQHSSKPPRRPTELVASIPLELERVVLHALEKNPLNRPLHAGAFRVELQAAAKRAGLDPSRANLSADEFENGNGVQPTGRFVLGTETAGGQPGNGRTFETTALTSTAEKPGLETGNVAVVATATDALGANAAPTLQAAPPFTRVSVLLSDRRTLLQRLKQPHVMLASALVAFALVIGVTAFVRTNSNSDAAVSSDNANFAMTPTPTPSPTPTPEATPTPAVEAAATKKAGASKSRRASPTTRSQPKKGSKVAGAFKKLKRVLNPF